MASSIVRKYGLVKGFHGLGDVAYDAVLFVKRGQGGCQVEWGQVEDLGGFPYKKNGELVNVSGGRRFT